MRTTIEIGASVPALLIGGELHGQRVPVRLGLAGLPRFLVFPKMIVSIDSEWIEKIRSDLYTDSTAPPPPVFTEVRYRLYDDVPAKYLHESEWKDDGDDDDGPNESPVTPEPGLLQC